MAEAQLRRDRAYYKSAEYKRVCRQRKAERQGREFRLGVPGRAPSVARLRSPDQDARLAWREWISQRAPAWWLARYRVVRQQLQAERARAKAKRRYDADPARERNRTRQYKDANPARVQQWHLTRQSRMRDHGVETISNSVRHRLFERANCPYCLTGLADAGRELDHIIPIALGGRHEARNLVACCPPCNRRKAARSFSVWVQMLTDQGRASAIRMFRRRFGPVLEAEHVAMWA